MHAMSWLVVLCSYQACFFGQDIDVLSFFSSLSLLLILNSSRAWAGQPAQHLWRLLLVLWMPV